MMKKHTLALAMLTLMSFGAAQAQTHFSLRLGGAFPTGKFADASANYNNENLNWGLSDNSKKGGAGIGFTVGGQLKFDISSIKGMGVIASADFMYNILCSDINYYYDEMVDDLDNNNTEFSITKPQYINIPVMVGLGYTYEATQNLGLFVEAGLGANIRMITNEVYNTYIISSQRETINTYEYNTNVTFAYRVGAGLLFGGKYTLGVDYFSLGTAKVECTGYTEVNGVEGNNPTKYKLGKITPTILTLRFGINF